MKALYQEWKIESFRVGEGRLRSISKDLAQYEAEVAHQRTLENGAVPDGDALIEVEVDDESAFPEMLENGTVFLHYDELDVLTFP
ncbi:MAG TPA: hypothetical protein VFS75_01415 [Candidatus Paceibacterota bacterium]|nr:hypothetical protein [Candidatus Paceibacterota bacterium]